MERRYSECEGNTEVVDAMIPILYSASETSFTSNGIGMLTDTISCIVTEERNGAYELSKEYPVFGIHYPDIVIRSIILASPNPTDSAQPFRVYKITKPLKGIVTIEAEHISYDLSGIPVSAFTATGVVEALAGFSANAAVPSSFIFGTDKTSSGQFKVSVPTSTRSLLGGVEGSILDCYGGEWSFNRFSCYLHNARGTNRGVTIRYGKNLTSLTQEENCASVFTGIYPYYFNDEKKVELPEKIVNAPGTFGYTRILPVDLTSKFETKPTEEQLRTEAQNYVSINHIGVPSVNLKVSFVQLEQSEEYKGLALLERVSLCDTVSIFFPELGVSAISKCISIKYNALLDRIDSIELGDAKKSIASTLALQSQSISTIGTDIWRTRGFAYMDLLWENEEPTTAFAAQTIPLTLTDYSAFLIVIKNTTTTNFYGSGILLKDGNTVSIFCKNQTATTLFSRTAKTVDEGINFTTGYSGTTAATKNAIPFRIYGIGGIGTAT